MQGQQIDY